MNFYYITYSDKSHRYDGIRSFIEMGILDGYSIAEKYILESLLIYEMESESMRNQESDDFEIIEGTSGDKFKWDPILITNDPDL
jgi:hypothetical protein